MINVNNILVTINKQHPSTFPSFSAMYSPASVVFTLITVMFMAFISLVFLSNTYFPSFELEEVDPICTIYITVDFKGARTLKNSVKLVVHDKETFCLMSAVKVLSENIIQTVIYTWKKILRHQIEI